MPVRAPASIARLHSVRRPSCVSARIARPAYSTAVALRAVGADLGDDRKRDVLRADAGAAFAVDRHAHALRLLLPEGLRQQHVARLPTRRCRSRSRRARRASRCGCRRTRSGGPEWSAPAPARPHARCPGAGRSRPISMMPCLSVFVDQLLDHALERRDRRRLGCARSARSGRRCRRSGPAATTFALRASTLSKPWNEPSWM